MSTRTLAISFAFLTSACASELEPTADTEAAAVAVTAPAGIVMGLRHNQNNQLGADRRFIKMFSAPTSAPARKMVGGDEGADNHRGYEWWMGTAAPSGSLGLPPGVVFGLVHSRNQSNVNVNVFGRRATNGPSQFSAHGATFLRQGGGDLGAPSGHGYSWYETGGSSWVSQSAIDRLPKWTVVGLKHNANQRNKILRWNGRNYDAANASVAPPPGFARVVGGDLGASRGTGYFWYEKVVGTEIVSQPSLRHTLPRSLYTTRASERGLDRDEDGLLDSLENQLAAKFSPRVVFDSEETARRPSEPVGVYQVRESETQVSYSHGPQVRRLSIRWLLLFILDDGYLNGLCANDDHPGDAEDVNFVLESRDGITWTLVSATLADWKPGPTWPNNSRIELYDMTHPVIYMAANKHHMYFNKDNDEEDSVYSDVPFWDDCNDDVNGRGAQVMVNPNSLSVWGNNVGEPNNHPWPFVSSLAPFFPGYAPWSTNNFYDIGPLAGKWLTDPVGDIVGDSCAAATELDVSNVAGVIDHSGDKDVYRVELDIASDVTLFTTSRYGVDTFGELKDASCTTIASNDDGGADRSFRIERSLAAGTYYIVVRHYGAGTGPYRLYANVFAGPDDHANTGNSATQLANSASGRIEYGGDRDFFRIEVSSAATLVAYSTGATDTYGTLYDANGIRATNDDGGASRNFRVEHPVGPGTYYLAVRHYSDSGTGDYTVHLDVRAGDDHGDTCNAATSVSLLSRTNGVLAASDRDYFRFVVPAGRSVWLESGGTTDTYGTLLDAGCRPIVSNDDSGQSRNFRISRSLGAGTYYVAVRHYSPNGTGSYRLLMNPIY